MAIYTVPRYNPQTKEGTLSDIARKYNTDIATLQNLNPNITDINKIQEGMKLNVPIPETSEVGAITNIQGDKIVQEGMRELDRMQGTPAFGGIGDYRQFQQPQQPTTGALTTTQPQLPEVKKEELPKKEQGKIKFINTEGQSQVLEGEAITPESYQGLINQGFFAIEGRGIIPTWATIGDMQAGRMQTEIQKSRKEVSELTETMKSYFISDATIQTQIDDISKQYETRIKNMEDINKRRIESVKTLGIRLGSRWTGGEGGMFGGIITEEERQGQERITDLQNQKNAAMNAARSAARDKNWTIFSKQLDLAKEKEKSQRDALKEYNQSIINTNKVVNEADKLQLDILKETQNIATKKAEAFAPAIVDYLTGDYDTDQKYIQSILQAHPELDADTLMGEISKVQWERERVYLTEDQKNWNFYKRQGGELGFEEWRTQEKETKLPTSFEEFNLAQQYPGYAQFLKEGKKTEGVGGEKPLTLYQTQSMINSIRTSYKTEPIVQNFGVVSEGYQFAKSLKSDTQNPADQIGLIYAFAKAMDPNSVVREGEYATVQKYAQSWAQTYGLNLKRMVVNKPFMTKQAMDNMKSTIEAKYKTSKINYENVRNEYGERIEEITQQPNGKSYLTDYSKAFTEKQQQTEFKSSKTGKTYKLPAIIK